MMSTTLHLSVLLNNHKLTNQCPHKPHNTITLWSRRFTGSNAICEHWIPLSVLSSHLDNRSLSFHIHSYESHSFTSNLQITKHEGLKVTFSALSYFSFTLIPFQILRTYKYICNVDDTSLLSTQKIPSELTESNIS